ncbi:MAG: WD40 repeat protein [Verrucomicrobiales bacterium]|jgi:WD40 repeat protein
MAEIANRLQKLCPSCGGELAIVTGGATICRHCVMQEMIETDISAVGSANADDYDIEKEIGRGGCGTVYLARDLKIGRRVAIKLLNNLRGDDEIVVRRFRAEAEAIATLDHPNIIPIYATGEMDGRPFFTMKLAEAGSLETRQDEFTEQRAASHLMVKLARAVYHAHERGILHRDLKPSNILLTADGEPIISDFGIAKRINQALDTTMTGTLIGTPAHMSPEQARGDTTEITTASDIFSLGTILFQLLTGRRAFEGESSHAVMRNVIETKVIFTRKEISELGRDLTTICMKCLDKDPERRFSSGLNLAKDLERWERGEPVEARRISTAERALRGMKRHPWPVGAVAVALFSLVAGSIVSLALWRHAESERQVADAHAVAAEENAYYATVANALAARERFDFAEARRWLDGVPEARREFEWRLVDGLSHGDFTWSANIGSAQPKQFAINHSTEQILLLTDDRKLHGIDPETGAVTPAGHVPQSPRKTPKDLPYPGLLHFAYAPDGQHYSVVDGDQLLIVNTGSNQIAHTALLPSKGSALWLDKTTILYAQGSQGSQGFLADEDKAWIYNLKQRRTETLPRDLTAPLAISPDGEHVALVKQGSSFVVFNTRRGFESAPKLKKPDFGTIRDLTFSPDGKRIAAAWMDGDKSTVRIYDFPGGENILKQEWRTLPNISFSAGAPVLVISGREHWFTSWRYLQPRAPLDRFHDGLDDSTLHRNGGPFRPPERLLTRFTHDERTHFYFGAKTPAAMLLPLPGDGKSMLSAGDDGTVYHWNFNRQALAQTRRSDMKTLHKWYHPTASHDGEQVFYMGKKESRYSDSAQLWNRVEEIDSLPPNNSLGRTSFPREQGYLAILDDGRALTRVDRTGEVICWQTSPSTEARELWRSKTRRPNQEYPFPIHASVTPDDRRVAVLYPGSILVVDLETHSAKITADQGISYGTTPGQTISISPDGNTVAVTGLGGKRVRIYDVQNLLSGHKELMPNEELATKDSACAFSPDGQRLYVANDDGWVRVFDLPTRWELSSERWHAHTTEITALAVSQSGRVIATAAGDLTILWSTEKLAGQQRRERLRIQTGDHSRNWLQFCGNDTILFHCGPDGPIEAWVAPSN